MSARILVVDDNPLNVKLLAAKLAKDYYIVRTAENGPAALKSVHDDPPDLILLDVMMPDMNGFEVCERLKADAATRAIPVVMVTALSDTADRVRGLDAGADDFLTKPINDMALMARVRSLLRLKILMDEWRLRESTAAQFSMPLDDANDKTPAPANILLLEDNAADRQKLAEILESANLAPTLISTAAEFLTRAPDFDMAILSLDLKTEDGLMLCAQLRAQESTRTLPLLLIADEDETARVAKGLDLGANDYLLRPLEGSELIARTRTQLRQKHHYDRMRHNYEQSLALALVDPLTGAFNRRYLDTHLPKMLERYGFQNRPVSVLAFDIDHFKQVNDTHGHAAGDIVLKEIVARVQQNLRPLDLVVRMGGEEFAILMPETDAPTALTIGERLRAAIADTPISVDAKRLPVTISLGTATNTPSEPESSLLRRADEALYKAKQSGRNKVVGA